MSNKKLTEGIVTITDAPFTGAVLPRKGSGVVVIDGALKAGPWQASPEKEPVAEIAAALLDEGTKKRSREAFRDALEARGTTLSFWADGGHLYFSLRALSKYLPEALTLLFEALNEAEIGEEQVRQVIEREAATKIHDAEDTKTEARHALTRLLYKKGSAGYRVDSLTERAQILAITRSDVLEFMKATYRGQILVSAVGDVDPEEFTRLLKDASKGWSSEGGVVGRTSEAADGNSAPLKTFVSIPGKESVDVYMGAPVHLLSTNPELTAFHVAIDLLGGGFSDHLMQTVRDRDGLTYGTFARTRNREAGGHLYWFAWSMFGNSLFEKGMEALQREIGVFLEKGISEKRLKEKAEEIRGRYAVLFSNPASAASEILTGLLTTGNPSEADAYTDAVDALSAKAVSEAARKHLLIRGIAAAGAIDANGKVLRSHAV